MLSSGWAAGLHKSKELAKDAKSDDGIADHPINHYFTLCTDFYLDGIISDVDDLDGDDYIEDDDDGPILDDDADYDPDEHGDQMVRGDVSKDVDFVRECEKMIHKYHGNKAFFVSFYYYHYYYFSSGPLIF